MKKTKRRLETKPAEEVKAAAPQRTITWWPWVAALVGLFVVFEVYTPAMHGDFVLDDRYLPFFSAHMSDRFSDWVGLLRPLLMFSYWLDFRMGHGSDPYTFHVTNVILHLGTSVMAALIAAKLLEWAGVTGRMRAALTIFSGALFLLHPLQTESVAYIASRSECLSVLFYYAAFAVFLYRQTEEITLLRSLAVIVLFGCAVATKEHTVTLPALLLLTDYFWGRGGIRKNRILYGLLVLAGAAGAEIVWRVIRGADTAGFGMKDLTPATYFFTQCRVIWTYLRMFFVPIGQNVDPDVQLSPGLLDHGAIFGLLALAALVAAAWIYRKRFPLAAFGVFVFLLLIAPTSSVVPIKDVLAERRAYLPFIGLALVCCEALRRLKYSQAVATGAAVLAVMSILTHQRSEVWANPVALWQDSVSKSPNKYRPRFQLAYAQYLIQQCQDSAKSYESASHLGPVQPDLLLNWGLALDCGGRWTEAIDKLQQSLQLEKSANTYTQLGMVYGEHQQMQPALVELAAAEKIDPNYDMIYVNRGKIYQIAGDAQAAAREFQHALALNPQNQLAQEALAQVSRSR
jgi:Tfp pilus assembly protein PilF